MCLRGPTKVKARKSILFTEGSYEVQQQYSIRPVWRFSTDQIHGWDMGTGLGQVLMLVRVLFNLTK